MYRSNVKPEARRWIVASKRKNTCLIRGAPVCHCESQIIAGAQLITSPESTGSLAFATKVVYAFRARPSKEMCQVRLWSRQMCTVPSLVAAAIGRRLRRYGLHMFVCPVVGNATAVQPTLTNTAYVESISSCSQTVAAVRSQPIFDANLQAECSMACRLSGSSIASSILDAIALESF